MSSATYSPEDNKLRLYVGRVPREEFLKLRAEGWTTLHKQREAGGGDFVAVWTPERRDTALEYGGGIIEDEDMGPEERAADRAERFSGYREKRTDDATGHADRYEAGPQAHGYQSQARADRAAARHDRIGDRASDAWNKAEYWQRRTSGVIRHALHKSAPGVRMGRIKTIEAALRKHAAEVEKEKQLWQSWLDVKGIQDPDKQTEAARLLAGHSNLWCEHMHPRIETVTNARIKTHPTSLYSLLTMVQWGYGSNDITGAEACEMFFSQRSEPANDDAWSLHYKLRLAYETQMLEAQGGRLEQCEVLPGGKLGGKLILKVSKSTATGRATSADILGPRVEGHAYKTSNFPGTEWAAYKFDLERLSPDSYTAPTPESLAELETVRAAIKAGAPKGEACPLVNPTEDDAERLQKIWNDEIEARGKARRAKDPHCYVPEFQPQAVCRCKQAAYSSSSKGTYGTAETIELAGGGAEMRTFGGCYEGDRKAALAAQGPAVCKIRKTSGANYMADRVIVITDKPQKPLPVTVWKKHAALPKAQNVNQVALSL